VSFVSVVVLESIALDPDINFIVFEADKKMRILFSFTSTFKFELKSLKKSDTKILNGTIFTFATNFFI